ncbi:unnamed protein product [Heterosigma akashiwo]
MLSNFFRDEDGPGLDVKKPSVRQSDLGRHARQGVGAQGVLNHNLPAEQPGGGFHSQKQNNSYDYRQDFDAERMDPKFQAQDIKSRSPRAAGEEMASDPAVYAAYSNGQNPGTSVQHTREAGRDSIDELCFPLNKMATTIANEEGAGAKKSGRAAVARPNNSTRPW